MGFALTPAVRGPGVIGAFAGIGRLIVGKFRGGGRGRSGGGGGGVLGRGMFPSLGSRRWVALISLNSSGPIVKPSLAPGPHIHRARGMGTTTFGLPLLFPRGSWDCFGHGLQVRCICLVPGSLGTFYVVVFQVITAFGRGCSWFGAIFRPGGPPARWAFTFVRAEKNPRVGGLVFLFPGIRARKIRGRGCVFWQFFFLFEMAKWVGFPDLRQKGLPA